MAETATDTSTSDRVRDRSEFGEVAQAIAPTPPAPPSAPPADPRTATNQRIEQSMRDEAAAVNPQLKKAQEMGERLIAEAEARRKPVEQADQTVRTTQGQQPSLGLRPFLSTVKGEAPENAIAKFTQALGIFGAAIGSSAKGSARAGLAALTGAMQGWHEGDRERANRAFADWREKMTAALENAQNERNSYREWFASGKFSLDQAFQGARLEAMMRGNDRMADIFAKGNMDQAVQEMMQMQQHHDQVELRMLQIATMHADNEAQRELTRAIAAQKAETKQSDQNAVVGSYTPEMLQTMGQQYFLEGKLPPGLNRQGAGKFIIPKIIEAGIEWAKANGLDPMASPAIRQEMAAAKTALGDTTKRRSVASVAVGTFDKHMNRLVELGSKVDRSDRPVVARYQLQLKGQYEGDADTAAYQAAAFEAAQEFAKISVGTAQGDAGSRDEARKAINTALNQAQLTKVRDTLSAMAHDRMKKYDDEVKDIQARVPGLVKAEAPKEGKIRVKRIADGKTGTIDAKDMSSAYEIIP